MSRSEPPGPPRVKAPRTRTLLGPYALVFLYRRWLRVHAAQECFAAIGIAIAVALVFAATVAESSIAGSSAEVVRAVTGPASLQLRARSGAGFDEHLLARVERLPGVRQAAPLLEQSATVRAANGRSTTIDLAGTDTSLAVLDGLAETLPLAALRPGTIGLSQASASALSIGAPRGPGGAGGTGGAEGTSEVGGTGGSGGAGGARDVTLQMRGRAVTLRVSAVLGHEAVGALARALVAVMPLTRMQQLAGLPGRITRIFVQAQPGHEAEVRAELRALADAQQGQPGGIPSLAPADQDVTLLREALGPSRLASGLFAAIGALLGLLLAFNAMLLTVPDRRQAIAQLRLRGTRRAGIVQVVMFQAACLGVSASLVGLGAGYALSVGVFHQSSAYLAEAFTLGSNTVVGLEPLLLAFGGGVLATCVASAVVLADLRRGRVRDAVYQQDGIPGNALGQAVRRRLFAGSVALLAGAGALYALDPAAAILATALLALATVLAVPLVLGQLLVLMALVSERREQQIALPVALGSLRTTTLRSLALAATGAVALFGSVALGGSRENLLRGIRSFASSYVAAADIWVTNPGDNQAVDEFSPGGIAGRIARVPGVQDVSTFQGGFLELGDRRVWIIARPAGGSREVLESEVVHGSAGVAVRRLGEGGVGGVGGGGGRGSTGVGAEGTERASTGVGAEGAESFVAGAAYHFPSEAKRRVGGGTAGYGWIAVSQQIAEEHHVGVGGLLELPTPSGDIRFRIAATTTNLAWPPGVIFMSAADYSHYWIPTHPSTPTALGVQLAPGANEALTRGAIARALGADGGGRTGSGSGLEVATAGTRESSIDALTSEGLGQLQEISTLLLVAAIGAMVAALASSLRQRREWLAGLRLSGAEPGRLRRILLLEATLMLGAGCLTGAVAGIYGEVVIDGFLRQVTGFPLASIVTGTRPLEVFVLVPALAIAIMAIPGWRASRVSPGLALESE
jgi:putative ABC transport system permease protein